MRPTVYVVPQEGTSPRWCRAFSKGSNASQRSYAQGLVKGPVVMFGSPHLWPMLTQVRKDGRDWYYGDHAYFGRGQYFRCTRNAMQHTGVGGADPHRFQSHGIPVRDWRTKGDHIVLAPNSETFLGLHGFALGEWIRRVTDELKKHTDRPVRLRWKKDMKEVPLEEDLKGAWALVTFTSNSAVDAILAGIPAFCMAPCAGLTKGSGDLSMIEDPPMPEGRLEWASVLADNQWTYAEMSRGDCWRSVRQ